MDIRGPTWELGVRYTVGNIEVGGRGGFVIFGGGFAKRGFVPEPPLVTGLQSKTTWLGTSLYGGLGFEFSCCWTILFTSNAKSILVN